MSLQHTPYQRCWRHIAWWWWRQAQPPPLQASACRVDGQLLAMTDDTTRQMICQWTTDSRITTMVTSTTTTAASICLQGRWAVAIDDRRHDRHDPDRQRIAGRRRWRQSCPPLLVGWTGSSYQELLLMPHWFLPDSGHSCGIQRNPEESNLAETPAKMLFQGTNIPVEWCHSWLVAGMDKKECNRNAMTRIYITNQ